VELPWRLIQSCGGALRSLHSGLGLADPPAAAELRDILARWIYIHLRLRGVEPQNPAGSELPAELAERGWDMAAEAERTVGLLRALWSRTGDTGVRILLEEWTPYPDQLRGLGLEVSAAELEAIGELGRQLRSSWWSVPSHLWTVLSAPDHWMAASSALLLGLLGLLIWGESAAPPTPPAAPPTPPTNPTNPTNPAASASGARTIGSAGAGSGDPPKPSGSGTAPEAPSPPPETLRPKAATGAGAGAGGTGGA
jgi:hypothetical protein